MFVIFPVAFETIILVLFQVRPILETVGEVSDDKLLINREVLQKVK